MSSTGNSQDRNLLFQFQLNSNPEADLNSIDYKLHQRPAQRFGTAFKLAYHCWFKDLVTDQTDIYIVYWGIVCKSDPLIHVIRGACVRVNASHHPNRKIRPRSSEKSDIFLCCLSWRSLHKDCCTREPPIRLREFERKLLCLYVTSLVIGVTIVCRESPEEQKNHTV